MKQLTARYSNLAGLGLPELAESERCGPEGLILSSTSHTAGRLLLVFAKFTESTSFHYTTHAVLKACLFAGCHSKEHGERHGRAQTQVC